MIILQNELLWHTWEPLPTKIFTVYEPKKRTINAPCFRDRVVHHSLARVIEPLFDRKFIHHSCACRKGKGTHYAVRVVKNIIQKRTEKLYFLKGDIKSYFPSINHNVLKQIIRKTIRDKNSLWLIDRIIDRSTICNYGIPIGALTSQLFANIYLDMFDHWIKDCCGIKNYVRYMDDFLIISGSLRYLKALKIEIENYLYKRLCLKLNPKTTIQPINHGIDFCGYRIFNSHLLPRKRNIKRAKKRLIKLAILYKNKSIELEKFKSSLMSFLGYAKHCKANNSTKSILNKVKL